MDDGRGPPKRIRGNPQSPNRLASSSISPPNEVAMRGNATLPSQIHLLNQVASSSISPPNEVAMRGNATLPSQIHLLNQVGQLGNSWSRSGQSIMVNNDNNHLIYGNNSVQHIQPTLHIEGNIIFLF
jgi:hypothetical protein